MNIKKFKLFESPDNLNWLDGDVPYQEKAEYPLPFSICFNGSYKWNDDETEKIWTDSQYIGIVIGKLTGGHSNTIFTPDNPMFDKLSTVPVYTESINCRIWLRRKIISYWYDTKRKYFYKALKEIEDVLTQKIEDGTFNEFVGVSYYKNDWLLDLTQLGIIKDGKFKIFNNGFEVELGEKNLVPLSKFIDGEKPKNKVDAEEQKKQELLHLQSLEQKAKMKASERIPGWKPKESKYKMPGESEIEAKFRLKNMYQEKTIIKFKDFKV